MVYFIRGEDCWERSPQTKYTICSTLESLLTVSLKLTTSLLTFKDSIDMTMVRHDSDTMLGITNLHNSMILSTLNISFHRFAFGFPKIPHTNGDLFLTYKPMIIPLISQCATPSQQSSPKIKYTIEPPMRPMEPSNSLSLIVVQLNFWSLRTKYTIYLTLESLF